jgi:NADH-quinone oxidoreductase subunit N
MLALTAAPLVPAWSIGPNALRPFAPEALLIITMIANLLTPFFITRRVNLACALVSFLGTLAAMISTAFAAAGAHACFGGLLVTDPTSLFFKALLLIFLAGIILLWYAATAPAMHDGDGAEFFTLLLGASLGMCLMVSTTNLLMLVLAMELASLPSYVLAGFRKTHRLGAEASLKYVLMGAASSGVMVYGLSLLYGIFGTLQIEQIAAELAHAPALHPAAATLMAVAIGGLIIGVGFKIALVPFHFWCPDVFEGAGIDVSAFLSAASKGAALVLLLRVLVTLAAGIAYRSTPGLWLPPLAVVLGILGTITATAGNTAAFVQTNLKRLLAYSSIAQSGYMLCAITLIAFRPAAGNPVDPARIMTQTLLLYLAVYLVMNLGAFTVVGLIQRETGSDQLPACAGLGQRCPWLALCMAIFMISLVGLPPLAGFNAKLTLLIALGSAGGWWWALAAMIGINTVLSLYFYLRVVRVMYFDAPTATPFLTNPVGLGLSLLCAAALIVLFFCYGWLSRITDRSAVLAFTAAPIIQNPVGSPTH